MGSQITEPQIKVSFEREITALAPLLPGLGEGEQETSLFTSTPVNYSQPYQKIRFIDPLMISTAPIPGYHDSGLPF
jgi:hypothetical protein